MDIKLGYGEGTVSAQISNKNIIDILTPNKVECSITESQTLDYALEHPTGTERLEKIIKPGEKIVIISSDITRPMPTWTLMPHILRRLTGAGADYGDISLVFALGSHRQHSEDEKRHLAGDFAYERIRCVDSDPGDYIHMGTTSRGTPVDITRLVAEADRRICLGNIEYHYFAGYSGGIKAIMPGVSTPAAIQANHSMMVQPNACAGRLEGNPLREDLEETASICPVDFIVNVILDEHKKIIHAVAGDIIGAHRMGCRFLDSLYQVKPKKKADIVITSQGGTPKDLNLYQTQKALDNAKHAVKDGGTIILVGSCREGLGHQVFEEWIRSTNSPDDLITRVHRDFQLGGHKAAAIAMVMKKAEISLVSEMDPTLVESIFMEPYRDLQSAVDRAFDKHGKDASVVIMPFGGSTLPVVF